MLGPSKDALDVPWASFAGDRTDRELFEVRAESIAEPIVGVQAFEVGEYGHEIRINDQHLGGFDLPPSAGWQYWVDTVDPGVLTTGENTIRIERADGKDAFAIGTAVVRWRVE